MSKHKKASNRNRAGVIPAWPGCRTEWWVILSIDAEDVADDKGGILSVCPSKGEAKSLASRINAAISDACKVAWTAGKRGERNPK